MSVFRSIIRGLGRIGAALLMTTGAGAAADLDIVVNRDGGAIQLFMATRADNFVSVFDLPPESLAGQDGVVSFAALRQGTWDIGNTLLNDVSAALDGTPITFQAMSMMVHPLDRAVPMTTPFEGFLAISVCLVPDPGVPLGLEDLHGYVGYIAYVEDPHGTLTLRLPKTGRDTLSIDVRDFKASVARGHAETTVGDGGTLEIGGEWRLFPAMLWGLLALVGIVAGAGLIWSGRWMLQSRGHST